MSYQHLVHWNGLLKAHDIAYITLIISSIPNIKIKHFAQEAKTLNASQMKKLESYKRYTLGVCFLKQNISSMIDDLGEMFIKIVKSSQNKAKEKLNEYKLANSKVADDLILTLRNLLIAYKSPGTSEERLGTIKKYRYSNKLEYIELNEDELDLSWINDQWWKLLTGYTNRKDYPEKIERRNFEACVLYQILNNGLIGQSLLSLFQALILNLKIL